MLLNLRTFILLSNSQISKQLPSSALQSSSSIKTKTSKQANYNNNNKDKISSVPHSISKLILLKIQEPSASTDESVRERTFREKRIETQNWNHKYWMENNLEFNKVSDCLFDYFYLYKYIFFHVFK